MIDTDTKPDNPSGDHTAMAPYWQAVETIMAGANAMRAAGEQYLPKFPDEPDARYKFRLKSAKFTNIYRDIVENLAQRPFAKEVALDDGTPSDIVDFVADVDGAGSSLHSFAGNVFFAGINTAIDWILVDYTKGVPDSATRADEAAIGARPYWCRYPASSVIAAYSAMIGGEEQFVHVRLLEKAVEREGYGEKSAKQVRVFNREPLENGGYGPATYEIWEERQGADKKTEWILVEPPTPLSIGVIPFVPFMTGRRLGKSWQFHPPMRDAADLQIELYQQESSLKYAKTMTAYPMLAGNGVNPPLGDDGTPEIVPVGPHAVLYAPPDGQGSAGSWQFIEPGAQSLRFLAEDIKDTIKELRELGRQPLTAQSGNLTVVTTAFAAQKGNAAIQAWAFNLKNALENALKYTALWLGIADYQPKVMIDTDFDLGIGDDDTFTHVLALGTGEEPLISREQVIHEAKRRNILTPDYDGEEDLQTLLAELEADDESDELPGQVEA